MKLGSKRQRSLIDVDPTARRDEDFYATPAFQTHALLARRPMLDWGGVHLEPCVGDGAIVRAMNPALPWITNDIVARGGWVPDFLEDARRPESWARFARLGRRIDVVVSNLPFDIAFDIAPLAYDAASIGLVLLLRLSWLEPTEARGPWLKAHPPTRAIVLPRYDYRGNGKTDSVTSTWLLWAKQPWFCDPGIEVVTKDERDALIASGRPQ